jgi:sporulenol synthase
LNKRVNSAIEEIIQTLRSEQSNDGSWRYCFESGPMTDAYTIILLRALENDQEE